MLQKVYVTFTQLSWESNASWSLCLMALIFCSSANKSWTWPAVAASWSDVVKVCTASRYRSKVNWRSGKGSFGGGYENKLGKHMFIGGQILFWPVLLVDYLSWWWWKSQGINLEGDGLWIIHVPLASWMNNKTIIKMYYQLFFLRLYLKYTVVKTVFWMHFSIHESSITLRLWRDSFVLSWLSS